MGNSSNSGMQHGVNNRTKLKRYSEESLNSGEYEREFINNDVLRWSMQITDAQEDAIIYYSSNVGYTNLNNFARQSKFRDEPIETLFSDPDSLGRTLQRVDEGLAVYENTVPREIYRGDDGGLLGVPRYASLADIQARIGTDVRSLSPISASVVYGSQFLGKILYKIEVPKGRVGAPIEGISQYETEREFLIRPGCVYNVKGARLANQTDSTERYYDYVVRLEIIGRY